MMLFSSSITINFLNSVFKITYKSLVVGRYARPLHPYSLNAYKPFQLLFPVTIMCLMMKTKTSQEEQNQRGKVPCKVTICSLLHR